MKLTDFSHATSNDYSYLKQRIDELPKQRVFVFDNCELPSECTPTHTMVSFSKETSERYVMRVDNGIKYSGTNQAIHILCDRSFIVTEGFDQMQAFLLMLSSDSAIYENATLDLNSIMEVNALSISSNPVQLTPDFQTIYRELGKTISGQDMAISTIAHQTAMHLKKKYPKKPLSFILYGGPGTGKSETAKLLARIISRNGTQQYTEIWTDLNTFTEAHSVYRLIGSPPGYVGYDDIPVFETVTKNPYTVYVFDELDKAHPEVLKIFMSILDEGRCASRKELANNSREYDFRHCIFIFTSNYNLGSVPSKWVGFASPDELADIIHQEGAVEISYHSNESVDNESIELTKRIYHNTESARKAFVEAGVLREIASRFNCFVRFDALSDEAKIRILAKQIVDTGFEYNVRLTYISSGIMQSLIDASMSENTLTVRSFKSVIDGYLSAAFYEASESLAGHTGHLEGTIHAPIIKLA